MRKFINDLFGDLCPWARLWLYMGLAALAAAAWMSFMVGLKMTWAHAIFLAILSGVAAFLPLAAERMWSEGRKLVSVVLAICAVPLLVVEFGQHAAYTAGIRGHELATTKVQNTRYDGAQDTVAENKEKLAMFVKRLQTLEAENAWVASTNATALRAQVEAAQKAIDLEAARGGCKAKCLDRMKEKAGLEERIAKAEERADLAAKIEAAKRGLEGVREKAATVEHRSSQTEHMNRFLTKAVAIFGYQTTQTTDLMEEAVQNTANFAVALAGTGLPALALFVVGLFMGRRDRTPHAPTRSPAPAAGASESKPGVAGGSAYHAHFHHDDRMAAIFNRAFAARS